MLTHIPSSTLEKFTTFGDLLRFLRRRVGLTQMELAIQVGYSDSQISRLEQNLRLPDIPTIQARFVPALFLEDEPETVARFLDLAASVRREDAPAPGFCPYKGLSYFDEDDADLFIGREALVEKLAERVLSLTSARESSRVRFLAVVGASGSGKSSLLRAGLVPALRWNKISADWNIFVFTPTAHPIESLAATLTRENPSLTSTTSLMDDMRQDHRSLHIFANHRLGSQNGSRLLLVVDQFEEVFSLCRSEAERISFIDNLLGASTEPDGPVIAVIALRADFYAYCSAYDSLREAIADQQQYIGAMSDAELRRMIEESAQRGRWELELGLVDLLMHDVGQEPGALPLLSHALFETWQRRRGHTMTLSGYASSHGVRGAIAETAENVFTDQLSSKQRAIARRIFLRLTELNDETALADTRRRASFDELILKPEEAEDTRAVIQALADARLITTSEDSVEVAHEALIREWPTLHGWLEEDREALRLQRKLTTAALEWQDLGCSTDVLFRGARLAQSSEWAASHEDEMNVLEREFLEASVKLSQREADEREAQRQRELETMRQLAESEKARAVQQTRAAGQLRKRAYSLAAVLVLAALAAMVAGFFAVRSNANLTLSEARRLAAEANNLMQLGADPQLISLLTIRSLSIQYTPAGDAALDGVTTLEVPPREFKGHTGDVWGVTFSPDGRYLATGSSDGTARLWDLTTGQAIRVFSVDKGEIGEVAFSPDGKTLLAAVTDHTARLWDIANGEILRVFNDIGNQPVYHGMDSVAFDMDGKTFVSNDGSEARIWDVASGKTLHVLKGHTIFIPRVAYSLDGKYVLSGGVDKTARVWEAATGREVQVIHMPSSTESVAFSPDNQFIAVGNSDGVARIWSIATGELVKEFSGHHGFIQGIKFSPDGRYLLTGSADKTARLWEFATDQTIRTFKGFTSGVQGVAFSPDGNLIAAASNDGIVRLWNLQVFPTGSQLVGHKGTIRQASFSPDGKQVVTASDDDTARIWNALTGQTMTTLGDKVILGEIRGAVFSPDGKTVLTASQDKTARLWDSASGKQLRSFEGHTDLVNQAIFSPDGKYVLTTSFDGTARVWDAHTAKTIVIYTNQGPGHVNRGAFSPDGKTVVTSGDDGTARLWDPLTGEEIRVFKGHTDIVAGIAFSPDGQYIVTSSFDGSVRLWGVSTGQEVHRFPGHPGGAFGAAFSPDGKYVLSGGADGTARLWNIQTGQEERRFTGHTDWVRSAVFSPDGKYILTSSNDSTARLWITNLQDTIQAVCATLTRDLTPEERDQYSITDPGPTCPGQ